MITPCTKSSQPNQRSVPKRLVSLQRGAEYVDCAPRTIRRLIADRQLTGYRIGTRMLRVDLNELDALLTPVLPLRRSK